MKHFITTIVAIMMCALSMNAQDVEKKHEFQFNLGALPNFERCEPDETNYISPAFTFSYMRQLNTVYAVGASMTYFYNKSSLDEYYYCNDYYKSTCRDHAFLAMAQVRTTFFRRNYFRMYGRFAIGPAAVYSKRNTLYYNSQEHSLHGGENRDTDWGIALQVTPFGVELGAERVHAFLELGIGHQGIINAGVAFRF